MATVRNLKIKTSTCKRIVKELHSYEKEVEREAAKTADMKAKGADPYDLKQQENVLAESRMMVPDCRKRLEAALSDIKGTLSAETRLLNIYETGCASHRFPYLEAARMKTYYSIYILQAELEESGQKEGLEFDDARSIIAEVEKLFQSSELSWKLMFYSSVSYGFVCDG
ncbi:UNVERIFIED_CONTAM: Tubulin-folding cofactor A [Sesamum calycinum]|uniref:Tubulin-specific chaperone A n=1 Tax=Sesamum calycinum TaxID=2727403 RepID=A0AAW2NUQ5_9LAMI